MDFIDCKLTDFYFTVDIWMVNPETNVHNIPITPRWKLLGKLFKDEISSVYKYDIAMYHLMFISVIDIGYNEYRQRCNLIRLTYGRTNN